jgi:D-threonate/D-erythronate kinase
VWIEPSSQARTFIIADDLTGACDAAVAFSTRGFNTDVLLDAKSPGSADIEVCATCTQTRETSANRAAEAIHRIAQRHDLKQYGQIFKKIDSTFRGNTFHEIRAALDAFRDHFVVVAPAYPALGRISVDGILKIRDVAGKTSIAVRDGLHASGLRPHWISAGQSSNQIEQEMSKSLRAGNRIVFCDAATNEDLKATVGAARALQQRILWIGSAGLAHALAADLRPQGSCTERHANGSVLIFVGSNHLVTEMQVADLRKMNPAAVWPQEIADQASPENAATIFRIERSQTTEDEIRIAVANFKPHTVSCLFMTGGDTAMLVCRALGIHSLSLHKEFEPGVPQATALGGPFTGCNVILKSGGFGRIDVLSRVVKHFSHEVAAL